MPKDKDNPEPRPKEEAPNPDGIRWWPAWLILFAGAITIGVIQANSSLPFQRRNMDSYVVGICVFALLLIWWLFLSRTGFWRKLAVLALLAVTGFGVSRSVKIVGVTGDLVPVVKLKWKSAEGEPAKFFLKEAPAPNSSIVPGDYPQFLGPNRDGRLSGPKLAANWDAKPPAVLWRVEVGPAWSGFAAVGDSAITQEQHGDEERVVCYNLQTGERKWSYGYPARYFTPIAGEGPRTTPTIVSSRVWAFGATGWLSCLDLATGAKVWSVDAASEAGTKCPEWGFSGSPLVADGKVIVPVGGDHKPTLCAFDADSGKRLWSGGNSEVSYGSAHLATLAGVQQILVFGHRSIEAFDPRNGARLWDVPWGVGFPLVAAPIVMDANRVMFTAGYAVGAELFEIRNNGGKLVPASLWKSNRMKAKFSNPVLKDGYVYGLDDGILACIDIRDGSLKWKGERYGHGQALLVGDRLLLMTEEGKLVLLKPTPEAPNELTHFQVFQGKTWNPIALAGNRCLARTDREAVCLVLPLEL